MAPHCRRCRLVAALLSKVALRTQITHLAMAPLPDGRPEGEKSGVAMRRLWEKDDALSSGISRRFFVDLPKSLYYCLGNIGERRIDPIGPARLQGQRPVRVGPSP